MNIINRLFVILFLLLTTHLFAWGTTGHRIVAEIAERNLTRKTKKELKKLIGNQSLSYWANWPDEIKSDTLHTWEDTFKWHYVNVPFGLSYDKFVQELKNYKTENLYSAIQNNQNKLRNKNLSIEERKIALIFLIHLMGDLVQPMHVGKEEDLGGNKIKVNWFSEPTNLHSVWDTKLIDYYRFSYTEYTSILDVCSKKDKNKVAGGILEEWIYDSYQAANKIYAEIGTYLRLDYQYAFYNKELLEDQLLKGGLRLARVLNELLG